MLKLFEDIVPTEKQCQNYRLIATSPIHGNERILLEKWSEGFQDRDNKFVKEFQISFNSCFWELYLYQCFKSLGFEIDFANQSPDFSLNSSLGSFVAEATISSNPEGFIPEHQRDFNSMPTTQEDFEKVLYLASTRIANSFTSKFRRYKEYYQYLDHVKDRPYVICIAPFEQPFAFIQNDVAVRRVLYSFNEPLYYDNPTTGRRTFWGTSKTPLIYKENGAEIDLGFFTDNRFPEVSAVIFSSTATMTKLRAMSIDTDGHIMFSALRYNPESRNPWAIQQWKTSYNESLLDGLHVYINPHAKHRLNIEKFSKREIALHYYLPRESYYWSNVPYGFLISHGCITLTTGQKERIEDIKASCAKDNVKKFEMPEWPEGELVYVGGDSGPFTDNYMAHWKGYTIIIVKDTIDNDWGAQALPGIFSNTAWYSKANLATESKGLILASKFFDTKEDALGDIKKEIEKRED